jgi:hypothetical protein
MAIESLRRPASVLATELSGELTTAAGPLVMAHERLLPIAPGLAPLFGVEAAGADAPLGLMRGHTVMCGGPAAMSCALAIAAAPSRAGSWVAVVGESRLGPLAAAEAGIVLERTVFIDDPQRGDPASVLSALIDGIDVLLVPSSLLSALSPSLVRRAQSRAQSRGAILLVAGHTAAVVADLHLTTRVHAWEGLGEGFGHLRRRRIGVELDRRRGRPTRGDVWMPGAPGDAEMGSAEMAVSSGGSVVPLRRTG